MGVVVSWLTGVLLSRLEGCKIAGLLTAGAAYGKARALM
jgi:hypothetical protein